MCSLVGVGDVVGVGDEDGVLGGVGGNGKAPTPNGFDDFWKAYPKKVGKGDAERKFVVAIRKVSLQDMLKAIERQSASEAWRKDGGQYIPYPSTWLNHERWHDEVKVEVKPTAVGGQF